MGNIIGRTKEKELLDEVLKSPSAEFLAIYGRRRIGKTYLVCNHFSREDIIFFHVTGLKNGKLKAQLKLFTLEVGRAFYHGAPLSQPKNWLDAFDRLTDGIKSTGRKVVLFFDELPWFATRKSQILQALDYYWNRHWSFNKNIKLVVCGSSSSWIINNIINNKGGLHNRVTNLIHLKPFTLAETKIYLKSLGASFTEDQILQLYMAMGGIPHYLNHVRLGLSASQNIDNLCFTREGLLFKEYKNLFSSLFSNAKIYELIVEVIAATRHGSSLNDILNKCRIPRGGRSLQRIRELEESGFIIGFIPYGRKERGIYYRIIDEYTLFYLYWIKPYAASMGKLIDSTGYWAERSLTPSWKSWSGYAFESVCYKHIDKIRKALNITAGAGIGNWRYIPRLNSPDAGAQIDLLFDRNDDVVNICEIKYNKSPLRLDKKEVIDLQKKAHVYQEKTHTTKQIFLSLITAGGFTETPASKGLIASHTTLKDLF